MSVQCFTFIFLSMTQSQSAASKTHWQMEKETTMIHALVILLIYMLSLNKQFEVH